MVSLQTSLCYTSTMQALKSFLKYFVYSQILTQTLTLSIHVHVGYINTKQKLITHLKTCLSLKIKFRPSQTDNIKIKFHTCILTVEYVQQAAIPAFEISVWEGLFNCSCHETMQFKLNGLLNVFFSFSVKVDALYH